MKILLIEDDEKIASFVIRGLKESGYAVEHCADGKQGFGLALAFSYDLAIVDIMLPGMLRMLMAISGTWVKLPRIMKTAGSQIWMVPGKQA